MVKSALRALQLLELLAGRSQSATHGDMARSMGVPKSSLTGLLATLEAQHYVRRIEDGGAGRFALGPAVLPLAGALLRQMDIVALARPVLRTMMRRSGESAALVVRAGDEVMVVARETCDHPVSYSLQIGQRGPISTAAAGKALLGAASQDERERYLASATLVAQTPNSITDPASLRRQLDAISAGGIALAREEMFEGVVTMALAVRDATGSPVASLSIGMPSMRFVPTRQRLVEQVLRDAAGEVSLALGWREPVAAPRPAGRVARRAAG